MATDVMEQIEETVEVPTRFTAESWIVRKIHAANDMVSTMFFKILTDGRTKALMVLHKEWEKDNRDASKDTLDFKAWCDEVTEKFSDDIRDLSAIPTSFHMNEALCEELFGPMIKNNLHALVRAFIHNGASAGRIRNNLKVALGLRFKGVKLTEINVDSFSRLFD